MTKLLPILALIILCLTSCDRDRDNENDVEIPDFNFPQTIVFEDSLSKYKLYQGIASNLNPSEDFHLLELSSILFTDYAYKQRLIKLPEGTQITVSNSGGIEFPDGTILSKTFFYYNDDRDTSLGKQIIETRLLIKGNDTWNIASYEWNQNQTEAILSINGVDKQLSWINQNGQTKSTVYHVPSQNECMTCHQSNESLSPIGPSLLNLNRDIEYQGQNINQLEHLQDQGILSSVDIANIPTMVNYKDESESLEDRGRAYFAINCGHCHNPSAWDKPAERDFDFRHETTFSNTGIQNGKDKILEAIQDGEMPFIGTTMLDEEGIGLLTAYLESL